MKKLITIAALAVAGLARAGDYHAGEELKCQQCHTMHASRSHGFEIITATGVVNPTGATYATQFDNLLVGADTNGTCLSCHNRATSSGYDVFGASGSATMNGHRSAGALNGTLTGHVADGTTGYDVGTGHTLGVTGTAPGGTFSNASGFSCADCHAVHGNAAYRNLGDISKGFTAAQQPTYATTTSVVVADYDVVEEEPAAYDTIKVQFGFGAGANRMNAYCAKCHGNFHSAANVVGTGSNFKRHPTGTSVATERYDFDTATGVRGTGAFQASDIVRAVRTSTTNVSPGCLTCHKGHGNQRAFGLVHPGETAGVVNATNANTENGDLVGVVDYSGTRTFYNPKTLCQTCHVQGQ